MCLFKDAELYCVKTNMRMTSELMQFEIGTSTKRYLPPRGTAGFDRSRVKGCSRLPAPPPRITASKFFLEAIRVGAKDIGKSSGGSRCECRICLQVESILIRIRKSVLCEMTS